MEKNKPLALPLSTLASYFTPEELRRRPQPIPTGWPALDELIGGIAPGLYVLGAISGLGKSTFALQMAEQVAGNGYCPVLYFSLEMTGLAIAAKSLSRRMFQKTGRRVKLESRQLLRPQLPKDLPREFEAVRREMAENAKGLFLITPQPGGPVLTAQTMVDMVREFCEKQARRAKPGEPAPKPPLVIVDYLQIIPSPQRDYHGAPREITDENVNTLRRGLQDMPVLLISSLNRGSYDKPIQLFSFKESGGIEYSADVLLGLQFSAVREKGHGAGWLEKEKQKLPREVEIVVLKQRYGSSGDVVKFRYFAPYDCFQQEDGGPVREETGGPGLMVNNTYLANETRFFLAQNPGHPQDQPVCISVLPFGKAKKDIETTLTLSRPLSYWDMAVADGVFSLYSQRHGKPFQVVDLLRLLSQDGRRPKKGSILCQRLQDSIEYMMGTHTAINCAAEMTARLGEGAPEAAGYSGPFLRLERTAEGYAFPQERLRMPLYQYAQVTRQILSLSPGALATPALEGGKLCFSCTAGTLALKHYIARAVKLTGTGGGRQWAQSLYFTTPKGLFPAIGLTEGNYPEKKARARKEGKAFAQAMAMLRFYRDELGLLGPGQVIPESPEKPVRLVARDRA